EEQLPDADHDHHRDHERQRLLARRDRDALRPARLVRGNGAHRVVPLGAHGVARRPTPAMAAYATAAMNVAHNAMPQAVAPRKPACDAIMAMPRPDSPPTYSPMIAPSTAAGAAMRNATNRLGSAARIRTFTSLWYVLPPYTWTRSSEIASAERNPTSVP